MDLEDARMFRRWSRAPYRQIGARLGATVMIERCALCWHDVTTIIGWPPAQEQRKRTARDIQMVKHLMKEH